MNKRILLSSVSIFASLALAAGATFAFFSDEGTSTGNTFAAGTFDLKLKDADETTAADSVVATWNSSTMAPGVNPVTATLNLQNSGTIAGDNAHLKMANTVTDNGVTESGQAMDRLVEITAATYDAANILPLITDVNANSIKDLDDLESVLAGPEIGKLLDLGVDHPLVLNMQLHSTADSTYQGDQVSTVVTTTLHQDVTQ